MKFIDNIPWLFLIPAATFLGLAPFHNAEGVFEPHLVQKLNMLAAGTLSKPIDIFDLLMHAALPVLVVIKAARTLSGKAA